MVRRRVSLSFIYNLLLPFKKDNLDAHNSSNAVLVSDSSSLLLEPVLLTVIASHTRLVSNRQKGHRPSGDNHGVVPDIGLVVDALAVGNREGLQGRQVRITVRHTVLGYDHHKTTVAISAHGHKHLRRVGVALQQADANVLGLDGLVALENGNVGSCGLVIRGAGLVEGLVSVGGDDFIVQGVGTQVGKVTNVRKLLGGALVDLDRVGVIGRDLDDLAPRSKGLLGDGLGLDGQQVPGVLVREGLALTNGGVGRDGICWP